MKVRIFFTSSVLVGPSDTALVGTWGLAMLLPVRGEVQAPSLASVDGFWKMCLSTAGQDGGSGSPLGLL